MGSNDADVLSAEWIDWLTRSRGRAPKTIRMYRDIVGWWVDHLDGRPLDAIDASEIEAWLQRDRGGRAKGVAAPATQHRDAACLRGFYSWLLGRGLISADPTRLVSTPTIRNVQPKPIGDEQWRKLWAYVDGEDAILLGLGFFCGLRRNELLGLTCAHVDLGGRRLVNFTRKGGGEDVLPLGTMLDVFERKLGHLEPERLWPLLSEHVAARSGPVTGFTYANELNHRLDRLCASAGIEHVHPHQLRHSCATNLLRSGVPLAMVSSLLNHSQIQTTMRYLKLGDDSLRAWLVGQSDL